jgi:hypothetical protein
MRHAMSVVTITVLSGTTPRIKPETRDFPQSVVPVPTW